MTPAEKQQHVTAHGIENADLIHQAAKEVGP